MRYTPSGVPAYKMLGVSGFTTRARTDRSSKPLIIIADTTKGEGIESIANIPLWHGSAPTGDLADICRTDLERRYRDE